MLDQAHDLRRLATERDRSNSVRAAVRPSLLVVLGGKGGVGTTTSAVNLATALAQTGKRTLLVDADPRGGDAALHCRINERYTLADLLAGRRGWTEVIETTPAGFQLVAGARWSEDGSLSAAERLLELLSESSLHADVAVIDAGNSPGRAVARICQLAETIVMVTTSETAAVLSTFAAIRTLTRFACPPGDAQQVLPLHLAVNRARMPWDTQIVQYRLTRACHRLLGVRLVNFCPSKKQ